MTRAGSTPRPSPLSTDTLLDLVDTELSMKARIGHSCLLIVSLLATIALVSLWSTEPSLPVRTHVAFGLLVVIGLAWSAFALRVLTGRRILYVQHQIVAGRMAVTFTSVFVTGALALGVVTGNPGAYRASALGLAMLAAAAFLLVRARGARARLEHRRQALERQTGGGA